MDFKELVGKTLKSVDSSNSERVVFHFIDGTACESYHSHDCCESVDLNRIEGSVEDIIGKPITEAEWTEDEHGEPVPAEFDESWTWTRQRIRTENGEATFVWLGQSNGYYGEVPYFEITHGTEV